MKEWGFFKTSLVIKFGWLIILFILFTGLFYFSCVHNPDIMEKVLKTIFQKWQEKGLLGLVGKNPFLLAIKLFYHNLKGTFAITVLGFIPFFIGTILFLTLLPGVLGATLAFMVIKGFGSLTYFKLTAPHGIFEMAAAFYGASLGVYLSKEMTKKLFSRQRDTSVPFPVLIKQTISSYSLVIIPLLALAAVIEALVTPLFR